MNSFIKTGEMRPRRATVEQGSFRDMTTVNIIVGAARELYSRYSTEIWATAFWVLLAVTIWDKLG